MSLGGGKSTSTTDARLNGINISSSQYGIAIPLLYGQNRLPLILLWYGNFISTPHTEAAAGGKGGGGGGGNTTYSYTASMVMGLCEGPMGAPIGQVWQDKVVTTIAALGFTAFTGAGGQAAWSYLTTNFPAQAVPYDHTAYVAAANYALGGSAAIPNFTFEVTGCQPFNPGYINDAEPSAVLIDYCTEPNHSCNFTALGVIQGPGSLTYQSYCIAMGFFISPYESTQRAAVDFVKEILQITNSDAFMSAGVLKIVPYADTTVTGNGRTFAPNLAPLFAFTEDDLMAGKGSYADPIIVNRTPLAETFNTVRVEYLNRANNYNTAIEEVTDSQDIALNGVRVMGTLTFHSITTAAVAKMVAQLILQRQLYIRSTFTFAVRADYCLLEPMDLVSLTDSNLGFVNKLVRITEVGDDENDLITLTAEDMLVGTAAAPLFNYQLSQGYADNWMATPPSVGAPLIFVAPPLLVNASGGYEVWVAVDQGTAGSWGGCDVYVSLDNVAYILAGTVSGAGRYGALTAALATHTDPDTADTLAVALTNAATTPLQLVSGSVADFNNLRTLLYVDGEFMAYQTASITALGTYNLTQLRRGLYGSVAAPHASGSKFARIDGGIFRLPYDPGMIGQTMYFKFCSFNVYQKSYQTLAAATAYPYTLQNYNGGQMDRSALTMFAGGTVAISGDTAFKASGVSAWDSSCYSDDSYANGCSVSCFVNDAGPSMQLMVGLTTNPSLSNSYTNLAFAIFAGPSGALSLWENGAQVVATAALPAYTVGSLLNIVYDGKHVSYFVDGIMVRTTNVSGLTLFMQICFANVGNLVYGIDFTRLTTAAHPFTLRALTAAVAAAGATARPLSGAVAFNLRNFSSVESISGGCMLSFNTQPSGASMCGLTTNPVVGGAILAGWFPHNDSATLDIVFQGAALGLSAAQAISTDVLQITYDNFAFRWYRNGALILMKPYTNAGPLYLFGDFLYGSGTSFFNIAFLPWASATPQQFIARGTMEFSDTSAHKLASGASTSWTDGDAVSINGYKSAHLVVKPSQVNLGSGFGMVTAPPASINYSVAAAFIAFTSAGTFAIYESGAAVGVSGVYTAADFFAITYDGANISYQKNGVGLRSVALAGQTMFGYLNFYDANAALNSVEFGAGAAIPLLDTPQLNAGAVADVNVVTAAGPITLGYSAGFPATVTLASVTIGPYPLATSVVLTGSFYWDLNNTTAIVISGTILSSMSNVAGATLSPVVTASVVVQNGQDMTGLVVNEKTYALAANTTTTYSMIAAGAVGPGAPAFFTCNTITLKAEVIKR